MKHLQFILLCAMIYGCSGNPNQTKALSTQRLDSTKGREFMVAFIHGNPNSTIVKNMQITNLWANQFVNPGMPKTLEGNIRSGQCHDSLFGTFSAGLLMDEYGKPFLNDPKYGPLIDYSIELYYDKNRKPMGYYQSMEFAMYDRHGENISDTIMEIKDTSINIKQRYFSQPLYGKFVKEYNKRSRYPVE